MKSLTCKMKKNGGIILLILIFGISATTVFGQKNMRKDAVFFQKIEKLQPEMTKAEVKYTMGEPYKISFTVTDDKKLVEDIYYKTEVHQGKWTVVIYQCIFVNGKLVALIQKEYFYDTGNSSATTPL